MALANAALKSARVYLNDINGITWSDAILLPLLQEAHSELMQELDVNNTTVLKLQSQPITVLAGSLTLGVDQPANIIDPISLLEGDVGADPNSFQDMIKSTFLPYVDQTNFLTWWAWIGDVITFVGATTPRDIILRYEGFVTAPQTLTDPLGCIFAERFLGPRIAALAYISIGRDNTKIQEIADKNLYKLIQSKTVSDQRPTRRKAYRSAKGSYGPTGHSVPFSGGGGNAGATMWIKSTTVPDGIVTAFVFPYIPKLVSWNGLNQFPGAGYTLTVVGGHYTITFKDVNGVILTPGVGDDIREAV